MRWKILSKGWEEYSVGTVCVTLQVEGHAVRSGSDHDDVRSSQRVCCSSLSSHLISHMQLINISTHTCVTRPQWVNIITCHGYLHKNYKLFVSGMFMAVLTVWRQLIMLHEQCCSGNYLVSLVAIRVFQNSKNSQLPCDLLIIYDACQNKLTCQISAEKAIFTIHKKGSKLS